MQSFPEWSVLLPSLWEIHVRTIQGLDRDGPTKPEIMLQIRSQDTLLHEDARFTDRREAIGTGPTAEHGPSAHESPGDITASRILPQLRAKRREAGTLSSGGRPNSMWRPASRPRSWRIFNSDAFISPHDLLSDGGL